MITGAVASIIYGEPRLTNDIDLVINMESDDVENFADAFPIEELYCPPPEVIRLEIGRPQRGHFNLIHQATGFKADIYASGRDETVLVTCAKSVFRNSHNAWIPWPKEHSE